MKIFHNERAYENVDSKLVNMDCKHESNHNTEVLQTVDNKHPSSYLGRCPASAFQKLFHRDSWAELDAPEMRLGLRDEG